ncbi:MarR family transcriptional regulator [Actinomadura sp. J1-007]|nr:MarR family transcriptional regulator [Actinomadura sp. J1-007]
MTGMPAQDPEQDERLRAEIWRSLYDFFLGEHERLLQSVSGLGVSPGDLKALMRLVPGRGEPMRALADTWRCDASTVTWIVDRLERQGLVERRPHESDRRVKVVALSERGRDLQAALFARLYRPPAALADLPPAELEALHRAAARLRPHS